LNSEAHCAEASRAKISKTENQKATHGKVDAQGHSTGQKGAPMTSF
jgi:hypothetical protein